MKTRLPSTPMVHSFVQQSARHLRLMLAATGCVSLGMLGCGGGGSSSNQTPSPPFSCDLNENPPSKWMSVQAKWSVSNTSTMVSVRASLTGEGASDHVSWKVNPDAGSMVSVTGGDYVAGGLDGGVRTFMYSTTAGQQEVTIRFTCDGDTKSTMVKIRSDQVASADGAEIPVEWMP